MWQFLTLMNYILKYKLKKCLVGLDSSKLNYVPKNNAFQFYKNKKHTKNFARMDSKLFNIYKNEKYI